MATQQPSVQVNVRLDEDYLAVVEEYISYLRKRRHTPVSRSDIVRLAIGKLPCPTDAPADLRNAIMRIQQP